MRYLISSMIGALSLAGCGDSVETIGRPETDGNVAAAEAFVDAFYSFDSAKLRGVLSSAEKSIPEIVYYQGWAEGGNYKVVNRMPCKPEAATQVNCSITVKDDLMGALGIDFDVTDTFHLSFADGKIISVTTSSNDLQVYRDGQEWVKRERPELFQEHCQGYFNGGPTPGKCVQTMVKGLAEFAASDDFRKP